MEYIPDDKIPKLPKQMVVDEECIAIGMIEDGVIIQYIERDKTIIIGWDEVIRFGICMIDEDRSNAVEIEKPKRRLHVR
jgi:hypothetical protein